MRKLRVEGFELSSLTNLNVSFGQGDHLREDVDDMQVLHLVPSGRSFVQNVDSVGAFVGRSVVNDVGDQVVDRVGVVFLSLGRQEFTHVHVPG